MKIKFNPMMKAANLIIFGAALAVLPSCSSFKKIPYFQDLSKSKVTTEDLNNYSSPTIQPEDQISIAVSSLNPDASAVFNTNTPNSGNMPNNPINGYIVDQKGEIMLPLIGAVKVQGLTTAQAATLLQQKLLTYLKQPSVSVRLLNFKVAVLGDVLRPNVYSSPSERLTVTEALSLAGDLNITARRDEIILVRERDGKREYVPIDLTSKNLFQSPYFYLKSNDLIVVQPTRLKLSTVDTGYRNASLVISALSLIAITYSILK